MSTAIITGAAGLVGGEAVRFFADKGFDVTGIDNDMRRYFFGDDASTGWRRDLLKNMIANYSHFDLDIRDYQALEGIFKKQRKNIEVIIHAAAQPSHDWAAKEPLTDFTVNAHGTLNLLELTRLYCPDAVFIFISTNKVYGDTPNQLPFIEQETRWELPPDHSYYQHGIDESMSIDQSLHSLMGASKLAADIAVQEYGRYFGVKTACLRGGCLTGPSHSGAKLHGFLAYLVKCAVHNIPYTVIGYKGKQVRDNIHAYDLVNAFWHFFQNPRQAEVYNIGGGRYSNCSIQEAITICEKLTDRAMKQGYLDENRIGDHKWWISDTRKFQSHYPNWKYSYDIEAIIVDIYETLRERMRLEKSK